MGVMGVFIHRVWELVPAADDRATVLFAFTFIVPLDVALPHAPVKDTV